MQYDGVLGFGMIFHKDITVTLSVHKFALSCVGIWPVKEKNIFMDLRWIIAVFLEVIPMCIYFTEIYLHCNGAKKILDSLTTGAAATLALTRLITPRIHREELLEIVTSMMDDWAVQKDKKIRWVMKKYAAMSTRVTVLTFILVGTIVVIYATMAISAVTAKMSRPDNEIDNVNASHEDGNQSCVFQSASSRQAIMVVQAMQMFTTGILTFGTTSFFFGLAMHLCAQFDALNIKLSEFRVSEARRVITEMVQRHCHLIRLAECMEESFNASILMYLFVTSTLMCIDGYMLIVSLPLANLPMIIHSTSVLLLMIIQLSFYTFAGDYLEMKSTALSYATYNCDWYELPASIAKDFQIILMRASIPHQLTAGKFIVMNMITFKDILKSTASYLSVLRVMLVISTKENNRLTFYDMQNRMMPRTICFDLVIEQYNVRTKKKTKVFRRFLIMKETRGWNDESHYALNIYEKVLGIIGTWPLKAGELKSIARCSLAILIQISTIGCLSLEVYQQCLGTEDMMEAFLMDLSSVVSLSKLLVIRLTWRHTYVLVTSIIDDWSVSRDTLQKEIMMRYTHVGRIVSLTMLYLGCASGLSFLFMAVPFDSLIPWLNISKANNTIVTTYFLATYCVFGSLPTITYSCVLLLQVAQIFVNATSHCGNDGFFFGLAMHLCGQFEILQMDFAGIEAGERTCKKKIQMLIGRHCHLIRLADSFEYAFNMAIFAQVSMSVLLLCVEAIKHVVLILTMLVQLYLYCYAGDQLEYVTGRIAYSAYSSPWYDFDVKVIKNLPMVLFRGKMSHQITAGKFLPMNLFSFKEILKATGSYLSVLRVMIDV